MVAILEEHGPERMLVNSAVDWGIERPAEGRARPRGACWRPASRSDDVDQVVWRNPVEFFAPERAASTSTTSSRAAARRRRSQGNSRPARRAGGELQRMRFRHPDGTLVHLGYCTNVHPAEDLDGRRSTSSRVYAARSGRGSASPRLGVGLWLAADAAAGLRSTTSGARRGCARELDRRGLEVVHAQRLPVRGASTRRVVKRARLPAGLGRPGAGCAYTLDLARAPRRAAARRRRRRARSRRCRSAGARRGGDERRRPGAQRAAPARRRAGTRSRRDRPAHPHRRSSPSPAAVVETTEQAGARPRRRWRPSGSASASTPATSRCVRGPAEAARRAGRRPASRSSRCRSRARCACRRPARRARRRGSRPFAEPRFLHQVRERRERRTSPASTTCRDALAAACRRGARGACTSTSRCTTDGRAHDRRHELRGDAAPRSSAAPTPLTRHLEVETYTWSVLARATPARRRRRARRRHRRELAWTRDQLRRARSDGGGRMTSCVVDRRRRADPELAAATCRGSRRSPADGFQAALGTVLPAVTCSVQSTFAHRPAAVRARHRRQRLVLPRPRRGLPLAAAQRASSPGEKLWEAARRAEPRLPGARTSAGGTRWARHRPRRVTPRPDLPRRRAQVARTATPTRRAARRAAPPSSATFPLFHLLGAARGHRVVARGSPTRPSACSRTSSPT